MASKSNFISAFRQAVTTMQTSYNQALELAKEATALGWGEAELSGELAVSSDISAADIVAAMTVIQGIETTNAGIAATLLKMHP
jgi:hypothetical protein